MTSAQPKPVMGSKLKVGSLEEVLEFLEEAGNSGYYINARLILKSGVIVDIDAYGNVRVESAHECYCGGG